MFFEEIDEEKPLEETPMSLEGSSIAGRILHDRGHDAEKMRGSDVKAEEEVVLMRARC